MPMTRHYKAITDHVPIDYHAHLNRIDVYFNWKHRELVELFERRKLRELEGDDCQSLICQLKRRLTSFALDCNALPLRTPRQLMATARAIARNPLAFLKDPGKYDPEVVARIYDASAIASRENQLLLADFECRRGPPPPVEDLVTGAQKVLNDLEATAEGKSHRGGQTLALQRELAVDLARIFKAFGGRVTRITRFDQHAEAQPLYREVGPFHDFLKLVLPPAFLFAKRAGFKMKSIRSIVGMSKGVITRPGRPREFPFRNEAKETTPARIGNFFILHGHRFKSSR
jgi:hypothetical protein